MSDDWPMSPADVAVIRGEVTTARAGGFDPLEIIVSSRLLAVDGLRVIGLPVRRNDELEIGDGMLVADGREPRPFTFEGSP